MLAVPTQGDRDIGPAPDVSAAGLPLPPTAPETRRLYAADWTAFEAWCRRSGAVALPADADEVAAYLTSLAVSHRPGSLARKCAAILDRHRRADLPLPDAVSLRALLGRLRRDAAPATRTAIIGRQQLVRIALSCAGDRAGLRDRALLLILAASGLGRAGDRQNPLPIAVGVQDASPQLAPSNLPAVLDPSPAARLPRVALLGLHVEHVHFTEEGVELLLSDGDADAPAHRITLRRTRAFSNCPVHALEDWLRAADCRYGPVFCKVDRWGNVEHRALTATALRQILLRRGAVKTPHRLAPREIS